MKYEEVLSVTVVRDILREVHLAQQYLHTKGLTINKTILKLEAQQLFLYEDCYSEACNITRTSEMALLRNVYMEKKNQV